MRWHGLPAAAAHADWRGVFGSAREAYPDTYTPRPASRRYVLHLAVGMRRVIPRKTSPKPLRCGCSPVRAGGATTPAGRHCASWSMSTS